MLRNHSLCAKQSNKQEVHGTVEPPNNRHIGGGSLVHCREVVQNLYTQIAGYRMGVGDHRVG